MWKKHVLCKPDDGGSAGDGGAAAAPAPAASAAAPAHAAVTTTAAAPAAQAAYWPEDWRQNMAGSDEKELAQAGRYASPKDVWNKARALEKRLSAGELRPVLGKDAKPEEVAEYRAAMGIPEAPDKYDLGNDMTISEADKPLIAKLFSAAHGTNQTTEQVKASVKAYREIQTEAREALQEKDSQTRDSAADALRSEWGPDFRRNINLINGLLDGAGSQSVKDAVLDARLPDGTKFGNSPEVMKLLVGLALVQNPAGVVVPGGSGDQAASIDSEIGKIEKVMRENRAAYNKDEKLQARYRELLGARETVKPRKSA